MQGEKTAIFLPTFSSLIWDKLASSEPLFKMQNRCRDEKLWDRPPGCFICRSSPELLEDVRVWKQTALVSPRASGECKEPLKDKNKTPSSSSPHVSLLQHCHYFEAAGMCCCCRVEALWNLQSQWLEELHLNDCFCPSWAENVISHL